MIVISSILRSFPRSKVSGIRGGRLPCSRKGERGPRRHLLRALYQFSTIEMSHSHFRNTSCTVPSGRAMTFYNLCVVVCDKTSSNTGGSMVGLRSREKNRKPYHTTILQTTTEGRKVVRDSIHVLWNLREVHPFHEKKRNKSLSA